MYRDIKVWSSEIVYIKKESENIYTFLIKDEGFYLLNTKISGIIEEDKQEYIIGEGTITHKQVNKLLRIRFVANEDYKKEIKRSQKKILIKPYIEDEKLQSYKGNRQQ